MYSDLETCLIFNAQPEFTFEDINTILAVWEGQHDGDDWRWILELNDGRFVFLQGGCDYTGWDCQSWAESIICDNPEAAAAGAMAGFGYRENGAEVYESLIQQLYGDRNETWREMMDKEFGID